eukprot:PITA_21230
MQLLPQVMLNAVTLLSVLPARGHLAALEEGKWIHDCVVRNGFKVDVPMGTALIMYAKCGSIEIAQQLFDGMSKRDLISWNAIIGGYGMHGHGDEALELFSQMQQTGVKLDHITFIGILTAYSHSGLVHEGRQCFDCMSREYCITPRLEHYACMVNLLGHTGHLDEAEILINNMPFEPDAGVWGTLLGACRAHHNIELVERAAEHLFQLEPKKAANYVLLSNIYAAVGWWDGVAKMKKAGYVADRSFVLHDVEDDDKEFIIGTHSEKLAIAFGLLRTDPVAKIQITKNLRVCGDCHSAIKYVSKIVSREIIVRDPNHFDHFRDGLCSCGDYW